MRASDEFVEEEEDDEYDEYVHMGRPNKTALKRLMSSRRLTAALCELPEELHREIDARRFGRGVTRRSRSRATSRGSARSARREAHPRA